MKKIIPAILLIAMATTHALGKEDETKSLSGLREQGRDLRNILVTEGFENIVIRIVDERHLLIEYENRRYRYEMTGMGVVLALVAAESRSVEYITLMPKNRDIPLLGVTINIEDYRMFVKGELPTEIFASRIQISQNPEKWNRRYIYQSHQANSSLRKFDLIPEPDFKSQFSMHDDPVQLQFNLIPQLSTTLARGLLFKAQMIIPLYNEYGKEFDSVRPGRTILNQTVRLPQNFFASVSAGYFGDNRYGLSIEMCQFILNGSLAFSSKVDHVGYISFENTKWYQSKLEIWSYLFTSRYRFSTVDFSLAVSWGHYLYGDEGWKVEVLRSFDELDLGFWGLWTHSVGLLTGITLNVPFPFSRQNIPRRARIGVPASLMWQYRYLPLDEGIILNTENSIEMQMKRLFPSYVKNNLDEFRRATHFVK